MNTGGSLYNADFIHSGTNKYYFVELLVSFNFIGATNVNRNRQQRHRKFTSCKHE